MGFSHIFAILGACLAKLASSADDVVWLLPFVSGARRSSGIRSAVLYVATLEFVVLLSWIIALAGGGALRLWLPAAQAEEALQYASAILLACYALFLWSRGPVNPEHPARASVVIISFLGSLDELSYFPGLQWSGLFSPLELAAGTALAGAAVVGICLGAGGLKGVSRRLEAIPLWLIVAVFAGFSFAQAVL
ncbi:MAG TPA: hypothetical protein PKV72_05955 [Candidatus Peribacteria bacterium]|nr:hypothetical protein [Candidatus Peribacteria bacterium]